MTHKTKYHFLKQMCAWVVLSIFATVCLAQKPPLKYSTTFDKMVASGGVSNNGKYVYCGVQNETDSTLVLRSVDNTYEKKLVGNYSVFFSDNSRYVLFQKRGGSALNILDLLADKEQQILDVRSFKVSAGEWFAYLLSNRDLVVQNLSSGNKKQFSKAGEYMFSESGKVLLISSDSGLDSTRATMLQWVDLSNGKVTTLWYGTSATKFLFDRSETGVAFIAKTGSGNKAENSVWHYRYGADSARLIVSDHNLEREYAVSDEELKFTSDGKRIFFNIHQKQNSLKPNPKNASVDLWNYQDRYLQAEQGDFTKRQRDFLCVVHLKDNKIIRLVEDDDLNSRWGTLKRYENDNYVLVQKGGNPFEGFVPANEKIEIYLVNVGDGSRTCITKNGSYYSGCGFSPGGKYLLWYEDTDSYFSYDMQLGTTKNISAKVAVPLCYKQEIPGNPRPFGLGGWIENDEAVLIYDEYDIWKLDPAGVKAPINLTNDYGRKNNTILRRIHLWNEDYFNKPLTVKSLQRLTLCAFNLKNKHNGFFSKKVDEWGNPTKLIMAPEVFYWNQHIGHASFFGRLQKAKYADVYLMRRMSATDFPNLCITRDFTNFQYVSDLNPQRKYNWLTTELVEWKTFKGKEAQGILYKPENFNPQKKYPIIFLIYAGISASVNKFIMPELSVGPMDIPFFVSNEYLVFCPDISYTVGDPGGGAYDYVVSAAKMMTQKPFVDAKKMGIQGHSFGGYEVNYIITQTGLFAAAASANGVSDLISCAGTLQDQVRSNHNFVRRGQYFMKASLWENKSGYIKNSPVFYADKVSTPLLILHNKQDYRVNWSQGVEFYLALHELGKKAWMLQYDNGGHTLRDDKDVLDYSIRLHQFFDHYLKGAPAPKWMTRGIPAKMKGIDDGLELDHEIKTPGPGLLMEQATENQKPQVGKSK